MRLVVALGYVALVVLFWCGVVIFFGAAAMGIAERAAAMIKEVFRRFGPQKAR
ncbi:MAG TPA: hypothetical protein VMH39_17145 [Gemmatimonadaceae bacterium]|nr:hypothetical protein [Gemmatimonadaceae bacterium]